MAQVDELLVLLERPEEPYELLLKQNNYPSAQELPVPVSTRSDTSFKSTDLETSGILPLSKSFSDVTITDESFLIDILKVDGKENFSLFIPRHRTAAGKLIDILYKAESLKTFESLSKAARRKVNTYLFNYAYSVAILHRPDIENPKIYSLAQNFPDKYIPGNIYEDIRKQTLLNADKEFYQSQILEVEMTATDLEEENRLAYFREDLGVNLHHWHWHLVYPTTSQQQEIVNKDRRGELFYYMHQQIIARYNFERFCNHLKRVETLSDWTQPIKEAYFPKLRLSKSSKNYASRPVNQKLQNVNRKRNSDDDVLVDLHELKRWSERIYEAIDLGRFIDKDGKTKELTEREGIDILGNMVEAVESLSPNYQYYGDLHNQGHNIISCIHDPDGRHLEDFGVMSDTATAMRDPIFYRWHAFINQIFQHYKNTLEPYTETHLKYDEIKINSVEVQSEVSRCCSEENTIFTFWEKSSVDINTGLNFAGPKQSTLVNFTHLQHKPFTYKIIVRKEKRGILKGTCRIFLAPKHDEAGLPMDFATQRHFFIELDKFTVTLEKEENTITRHSTKSSVTIPSESVFRPQDPNANEKINFCGCGWPNYMLIPKGTSEGLPCELFVMISNYEDDVVRQNMTGVCINAESYCGVRNKLYPDRRAMGFPFDRNPRKDIKTLSDFCNGIENMKVQNVKIMFNNIINDSSNTA